MIGRRPILILIAASALAPASIQVRAQQPGKIHRVGFLGLLPLTDPDARAIFDSFRQGLAEDGFVDGRNLVIIVRTTDGQETRASTLVAELLEAKVDALVTVGSAATLAAKRATATVPIVMAAVPNPERIGLVTSIARPGGNVTGVSTVLSDLSLKILEIAREALPDRKRAALLTNSDFPAIAAALPRWPANAARFGFEPLLADIRNPAELEPALARLVDDKVDVLVAAPAMVHYRDRILTFAAKQGLPVVFPFSEWARHGALLTYGPDLRDDHRQVAGYVARILKGANPADLPVAQPTKFALVINLRTARALQIAIPPKLLARADEVIE